ncbi:hypothetical protein [Haliangium sp.]|uniref:hypothetical protein n=1 Tax=Haliangium sp. TaxID=2663208 RepID=UPI003D0C7616
MSTGPTDASTRAGTPLRRKSVGSAGPVAAATVLVAVAAVAAPVRAEPWALRVQQWPLSLRMRPSQPASLPTPAPAALAQDGPAPPPAAATAPRPDDASDPEAAAAQTRLRRARRALPLDQPRQLADRVVFRFNLGFGLDSGQLSGNRTLAGGELDERNYEQLRIYGFGDAVIGARGLGPADVSFYAASHFRFDHRIPDLDDGQGRRATSVPSVHDNDKTGNLLVRSAYGEAGRLFQHPLLAPIRVRAGRQYRYGPAVTHFDGVSVDYRTPAVDLGGFVGAVADPYGQVAGNYGTAARYLAGLHARVNLFELRQVPVVITGNTLRYRRSDHADVALALRWSRDISVRAGVRTRDRHFAREYLHVRARLSPVTLGVVELEHQNRGDWMYDLFSVTAPTAQTDATDPRRYLALEPPRPRTYLTLRAGTVLLDNIDLLARAAGAIEHDDNDEDADTTFASGYLEAGAALELRLQRTLAVGISGLVRVYARDDDTDRPRSMGDGAMDGVAEPLPGRDDEIGDIGETSFTEVGATARYSLGARIFSTQAEVYGRSYRRRPLYADLDLSGAERRMGGRISAEGWAGERLRIKAEYDVTSSLDIAPELRGLASLRVLVEGRF